MPIKWCRTVRLGREAEFGDAYSAALDEWEASGEAGIWAGADLESGAGQQESEH
ncbi:hypothetical protein [Agromyces aerolatus]|uniref:hypothetical protein n=1 Tax=Agromyces sp. LY-1074 TaxID=3074080 RepID=UPI00285F3C9A|nr:MULTISPECIES: hypothetical protein [unclassified Agromyces]MDR5701112.1 hypothetical protein [Agromyces sp. LY-1074]MDR5707752.1 hypothetical protein [Agromyces sp. LY-1358]